MISSQSELINNKMIIWKLAFVRRFTIQCLIAVQTTWFTSNTTLPECQIDLYTTCQEFRTSLAPSSSTCALPKTSGDHALLFSQPLQVLKQLLFYPLAVIWQESMEGIVEPASARTGFSTPCGVVVSSYCFDALKVQETCTYTSALMSIRPSMKLYRSLIS